tara:strand:- start:351 stop:659 length:309 start_codon:yes stop_codon:yes gene_type:complete
MKVKVFHVRYELNPVHIATVDAPDPTTHLEACEYAFRWTQNVEDSWSKKMPCDGNDAVTVEAPMTTTLGHRSSAMGDIFEVEGKRYKCAGVGFKPMGNMHVS